VLITERPWERKISKENWDCEVVFVFGFSVGKLFVQKERLSISSERKLGTVE